MGDVAIEATQADREAAADWHHAQGNWIVDFDAMRRGEMDKCGTVQAFARHRIAFETALRSRVAALEGALRNLLPSGAGLADHPDEKVIAFYITLGELRVMRSLTQEQQP